MQRLCAMEMSRQTSAGMRKSCAFISPFGALKVALCQSFQLLYRNKILNTLKVPVYCICRLQWHKEDMILCGTCMEWYHPSCLSLPYHIFKSSEPWRCSLCSVSGIESDLCTIGLIIIIRVHDVINSFSF